MVPSEFLTVGEAASFLGVSAETLRRWDRSGKLVATRRPGSNRRYYARQDLSVFDLDYARAESQGAGGSTVFTVASAHIDGNERLREPQREACRAVREHFAASGGPAILALPAGSGKVGLVSVLPFEVAKGRVLVIAPNLAIRDGIASALDIASTDCFWARARVLQNYQHGPYATVLGGKDVNLQDCEASDFVVTSIQQLAGSAERWLPQLPPSFFDMIIIVDGRHRASAGWRAALRRFSGAKVVSLSAAPFSAGQRDLPGEVIYRYGLARAMSVGYLKPLQAQMAVESEFYFSMLGDSRRYTLDEVRSMSEEVWSGQSVALSPECNQAIVEASVAASERLRRRTGTHHQVLAATCSTDHALQVRSEYEELGYRAAALSKDLDPERQESVLRRLHDHEIDCIVQAETPVEVLNLPALSIAAVFRPYRSSSAYVRFVSRVMQVMHRDQPDHLDNRGAVVSHPGLNDVRDWPDFVELEPVDQELVSYWTAGAGKIGEGADGEVGGEYADAAPVPSSLARRLPSDALVLDVVDGRLWRELLGREVIAGLRLGNVVGDLEEFRAQVNAALQARAAERRDVGQWLAGQPLAISDLDHQRGLVLYRLSERSNRVAARILDDLGIRAAGRQLSRAAGRGRQSNREVVDALMFERVNGFIGIDAGTRAVISFDQALAALGQLDAFAGEIVDEFAALLSGDG